MKILVLIYGFTIASISFVIGCNRKPQGSSGDRSPVDENFQVLIDGNPSTYIPAQQYNISLSCANGLKFISFTLVLESEDGVGVGADMLGHFELIDVAESKFSSICEDMIESTNTNPKSRIDLAWVAPTNPQSGCVLIKAAVLQHRNVWFIDDGFLTKRICPEEIDEINSQTPPLETCCACDEAKYEMILERKWSRNTHSKDFPIAAWRTRLSEIIGASHTTNYRFWEYGTLASPGLREMAEHGSTSTLETEIKASLNSGKIRTIIKAPGIVYRQNNLGSTMANVRVDSTHHIVSLVSKIEPSPDWILGVAGLELCLANCTWIERKELNLYPWDIGTDAGPSYMSSDQPQIPPDVIRRISSTFPSDHRSPFYDESGAPIKPLATLYIQKKKIYERECNEVDAMDRNVPLECATHPWNNFSECSAKCGHGTQYRVRAYKDPDVAANYKCDLVLRQMQNCIGNQCGANERYDNSRVSTPAAECEVTQWSGWSECSKKCGNGFTIRTRTYVNPMAKNKCQSGVPIDLEQRKDCYGENCGGTISGNFETDNEMDNQFVDELELVEDKPRFNQDQRNSNAFRRLNADSTNMFNNNRNEDIGNIDERPFKNDDNQEEQEPEQRRNNMQYPSENTIFGSEKFIERRPSFDNENKNLHRNSGNYRQRPEDRNEFQYTDERERFSAMPGRQEQRQFPRPHSYGPAEPNSEDRRFSPSPYNMQANNFDFNGRQRNQVFRSDEFNSFGGAQDYCYQKPISRNDPCYKAKVTVRNYWFYDAEDRQCKLFTTDNCDRNRNKFRTLKTCESACQQPQPNNYEGEELQ